MEYRTTICPRCDLPVLSGYEDDDDGCITQFCFNCGLEYVKDEIPSSFGIMVISYKDGRYTAESMKMPVSKKLAKEFDARIHTEEGIDIERSYLTHLNSMTFGIDILVGN